VTGEIRSLKLTGKVLGTYAALDGGFVSAPLPEIFLSYAGIPGDSHSGLTRKSGAREPWYKRGTPMRNERQLSIVSTEDLAEIAATLGVDQVRPEWIGANLMLGGIPHLSLLPPRTLLMFESGAAIRIDGDNGPCKKSGKAIATAVGRRPDIEFGFAAAARQRRGLVGWVEREGVIRPGDPVKVMTWRQTPYPG
jgi:hypothetical protein